MTTPPPNPTSHRAAASPRPLVLTQGDPDGVGPELLLRLGERGLLREGDLVVADPARLEALARSLGDWAPAGWDALAPRVVGSPGLTQVQALARGVDLVLERPGRALVTAPIDKAACQAEGFAFPGHTEYLAARAGGVDVAMLMTGPRLRVVLATVHVPLQQVPTKLTPAAIVSVGSLLLQGLRDHFGLDHPRVAVLGLNPHAGERGLLGTEEERIIEPALAVLRQRFEGAATLVGPLPADTAFFAHYEGAYDGVVAMYHDQGLGPFKLVHFHDGVNMTLGLPFVRTSPDHGTAKDIAGRGLANPSSMIAAVRLARGT